MGEAGKPMGEAGKPAKQPSAKQLAAAEALQRATQDFAEAQKATGVGAAEISGQEEVANQGVREGLEAASRLTEPMAAGEVAMGEGAPMGEAQPGQPGEAPQGTPATGKPMGQAATGKPMGNAQPMGQAQAQPGQAKPGQAQPGQGKPMGQAQAMPTDLGTGLVPNSPEATAQQIAGAEAVAQAEAALQAAAEAALQGQLAQSGQGQPMPGQPGQGQPMPGQPGQGQPMPGQGTPMPGQGQPMPGEGEGQPMPGQTSQATKGGSPKSGDTSNNPDAQKGELKNEATQQGDSRGEQANQDSDAKAQKFTKEPWFAKLPPALQSAIQAKARGKAPRGYEERLRRYFESID
jgi:hypothetical protein